MESLLSLTVYHWFALGLLLFAAEALGAAGFLLGAAAAALATGIVVWFVPEMAAGSQLTLFAIGSVLATYLYFKVFRQAQDDEPDLSINQRTASLLGHRFELTDTLETGTGRVQIGDTFWRVECDRPIGAGTRVEVVSTEGMSIRLAPVV